MTLIFELELHKIKMNQHAKCLSQKSFYSKVITQTQTNTHYQLTAIAIPGPLKSSIINSYRLD